MDNNNNNSIHDNILKAIEAGQVKMKPKWHFVARAVLLIVGTILLSLCIMYVASFIIFIMRQNGTYFVSGYGWHGVNVLLTSIPWILIGLTIVFIIVLQILIKKYSFGYGKPLMYSALGIIGLVIVGGLLLERTSIHQGIFKEAEDNRLSFFGAMYREFGEEHSDSITIGRIRELLANGYRIENPTSDNIMVIVTPQTKLPRGSMLQVGDVIFVVGHENQNIVEAEGIHVFDGVMPPARPIMMHDR
jgi:vacuolar-type H+-ATPase subunit I/STV1